MKTKKNVDNIDFNKYRYITFLHMTESKCVYFWNCMKELPNVLAITEDIEKNTSL